MASIKKCNICGQFYEAYDYVDIPATIDDQEYEPDTDPVTYTPIVYKPNGFRFVTIKEDMDIQYDFEDQDLCPTCLGEIQDFVAAKIPEETGNPVTIEYAFPGRVKSLALSEYYSQDEPAGEITVETEAEITVKADQNDEGRTYVANIDLDGYVGTVDIATGDANLTHRMVAIGDTDVVGSYRIDSTSDTRDPFIFRKCKSDHIGKNRTYGNIVGGTVAWNQVLQNGDFSDGATSWRSGATNGLSVSNGVATITVKSEWNSDIRQTLYAPLENHVYLVRFYYKMSDNLPLNLGFRSPGTNAWVIFSNSHTKTKAETIFKTGTISHPENGIGTTLISSGTPYIGEYYEITNFNLFDLTQMFGSTIADYIYSLEQSTAGAGVNWFKALFPKDYYAYNAGELISVEGIESYNINGFNQWDEEWENGYINVNDGSLVNGSYIRTANYNPCLPETQYYAFAPENPASFAMVFYDADKNYVGYLATADIRNKVFQTPANARYFKFYTTTTVTKICINFSSSRNGEYEAYDSASYEIDSSVVLRGIPKLDTNNKLYYDGDTYSGLGTITRKYGVVDLGTLTWTYLDDRTYPFFLANGPLFYEGQKCFCKYVDVGDMSGTVFGNTDTGDKCFSHGLDTNSSYIKIKDSTYANATAFKTAMSGVYLVYELAEPTTEDAEEFTIRRRCSSEGAEWFEIDTENDVVLPVGNKFQYGTYIFQADLPDMELPSYNTRNTGFLIENYTPDVNNTIDKTMGDKTALRGVLYRPYMAIRDDRYTEDDDFKEQNASTHILYKLRTPIHTKIDPMNIVLNKGDNIVESSTGMMTIIFRKLIEGNYLEVE